MTCLTTNDARPEKKQDEHNPMHRILARLTIGPGFFQADAFGDQIISDSFQFTSAFLHLLHYSLFGRRMAAQIRQNQVCCFAVAGDDFCERFRLRVGGAVEISQQRRGLLALIAELSVQKLGKHQLHCPLNLTGQEVFHVSSVTL
jgi:hypothetical protein